MNVTQVKHADVTSETEVTPLHENEHVGRIILEIVSMAVPLVPNIDSQLPVLLPSPHLPFPPVPSTLGNATTAGTQATAGGFPGPRGVRGEVAGIINHRHESTWRRHLRACIVPRGHSPAEEVRPAGVGVADGPTTVRLSTHRGKGNEPSRAARAVSVLAAVGCATAAHAGWCSRGVQATTEEAASLVRFRCTTWPYVLVA